MIRTWRNQKEIPPQKPIWETLNWHSGTCTTGLAISSGKKQPIHDCLFTF